MTLGPNSRVAHQGLGNMQFPELPAAWYYGCALRDLRRALSGVAIGSREIVLFANGDNSVAALDRHCSHMGADLARGCTVAGRIKCPFHEWEYDGSGACVRIPASTTIPAFARQRAYPTAVLGSHVFVFNGLSPTFDAPFFDGLLPGQLLAARPFEFEVDMPWYLVAANGFDLQHFRSAHDRTLVGEPQVSQPSPFAYRIRAVFDVTGATVRDRLTRAISGPRVTMTVTSWCGTLVLVTAEFARTTSYGMVCVRPIGPNRARVLNIIWVSRRKGVLSCVDPLDALIRRWFIRQFVESDRQRSAGIRYNSRTLIDADSVLAGYLRWLHSVVGNESLNGRGPS